MSPQLTAAIQMTLAMNGMQKTAANKPSPDRGQPMPDVGAKPGNMHPQTPDASEQSPYLEPGLIAGGAGLGGAAGYGISSALDASPSNKVLSTLAGMLGGGATGEVSARYLMKRHAEHSKAQPQAGGAQLPGAYIDSSQDSVTGKGVQDSVVNATPHADRRDVTVEPAGKGKITAGGAQTGHQTPHAPRQ